jgi:predicted ABC-type transport system involved in lysophospholipase L1 biosynthesis ATPase subunit
MRQTVIRVHDVKKDLPLGKVRNNALRGGTMDIYAGEMCGNVGPAGSGTSTR